MLHACRFTPTPLQLFSAMYIESTNPPNNMMDRKRPLKHGTAPWIRFGRRLEAGCFYCVWAAMSSLCWLLTILRGGELYYWV